MATDSNLNKPIGEREHFIATFLFESENKIEVLTHCNDFDIEAILKSGLQSNNPFVTIPCTDLKSREVVASFKLAGLEGYTVVNFATRDEANQENQAAQREAMMRAQASGSAASRIERVR